MYIRQSEISPFESKRQSQVIQPQTMKYGRLQVMHMHGIFDDMVTQLIRFTERLSLAYAATRHPHGKCRGMMITPVDSPQSGVGFDHGGTPEFASPDNKRVFQQTTLLEIP